jgi:hypothetical protein
MFNGMFDLMVSKVGWAVSLLLWVVKGFFMILAVAMNIRQRRH